MVEHIRIFVLFLIASKEMMYEVLRCILRFRIILALFLFFIIADTGFFFLFFIILRKIKGSIKKKHTYNLETIANLE